MDLDAYEGESGEEPTITDAAWLHDWSLVAHLASIHVDRWGDAHIPAVPTLEPVALARELDALGLVMVDDDARPGFRVEAKP